MKQISLGELALKFGVNKSKLNYWCQLGLIKPSSVHGKMKLFNEEKTIQIIKNIQSLKKKGTKLSDIKKS